MAKVTVQRLSVDEILAHPDFIFLLAEYAQECQHAHLPPPNPDYEIYRRLDAAGMMVILGALMEDRLVGFLVLLVTPNPHYGVVLATTESFFVADQYRPTGAGLALLGHAKAEAQAHQAEALLISAPIGGRLGNVLNGKTEYIESNRVFLRRFR